jgi:Divergent InlB B-repeat domain
VIRLCAAAASVLGVLVLTTSAAAVPSRALHGKVVVGKGGDGEGRVTSDPGGIDCGDRCTFSFVSIDDPPNYRPVTLTATASPGSAFEGFGACGDDKCTIDPIEPGKTYEVNATFVRARPTQFPLAVTLSGSGTVTSQPAGINCGATCSAMFATDSTVTLSASPTPGWSFTGWTGACTGTGGCSVTMADPRAVTATFAPPDTVFAFAVAAGGGSVTSDVPGIVCGEACVASFGAGVEVTLTASGPVAWGGACTGTGACVVPMARARAVTAAIGGTQPSRAPLAVSVTGKGSISGPAAGISCGTACGAVLPVGTRVTLQATPEAGWVFAGWSGSCRGVDPSCTVTARWASTAVASFVVAGTVFPVAITKVGQGTVKSTPRGINCGSACSRSFPAGTTTTIEATPKPKWTFVRWTGACKGRKPVCRLAMDGAKSASAAFGRVADPTPPRVRALASEGERGEVVQLRYRVVEAGGASRETASVLRGGRRVATITGPLHEVEADTLYYFLPWRSTVRGTLRFCVVSTDTAGNRSKRSCAPLHIT